MTVGVAVFEYHEEIAAALDRAAALGVSQCELTVPGNITVETAGSVGELLTERGLTVNSVASLSKINAVDTDEAAAAMVALLDASVRCASTLGAPNAIVYFGGHPTRPIDEAVERYVRLIRPSVAIAESLGVTILIENHFSHAPGEVTNTAQGCVDLVTAVGSDNFAVNFDLCNFAIGGQQFPASYETLKPHIRNVHIKDARNFDPVSDADYTGRIVTDLVHGEFMFVPVGEGITPNAELLDLLVRDGLDVPVTIEAHVPDGQLDDAFRLGLRLCASKGV